MENYEAKITPIEIILLVMYIGITDLIGIILVVFGLDDFFILDILTFPVTQLYLRFKGVNRAGYDLVANVLELFPYLGALPLRTIGLLMVIWSDRNPESLAAQVTETAAKAVPGAIKKGGVGRIQAIKMPRVDSIRQKI